MKNLLTVIRDNAVTHDDVAAMDDCLTPPYSSVNSSTGSPCSTVTDSQGPQSPLFQDDLSPVAIEGPAAAYSTSSSRFPQIDIVRAIMIVWRVRGKNYQVCSVKYCVQQLCTVQCTHTWTDLTVVFGLILLFCGYIVCYSLPVFDLAFCDYFVLQFICMCVLLLC